MLNPWLIHWSSAKLSIENLFAGSDYIIFFKKFIIPSDLQFWKESLSVKTIPYYFHKTASIHRKQYDFRKNWHQEVL
jgi:hypothetical protein